MRGWCAQNTAAILTTFNRLIWLFGTDINPLVIQNHYDSVSKVHPDANLCPVTKLSGIKTGNGQGTMDGAAKFVHGDATSSASLEFAYVCVLRP